MTNDEILSRLQRIYAALDATLNHDISSAKPIVENTNTGVSITQNFSGDVSLAEMQNIAHSLIQNIANLKDHAKRQLKKLNNDPMLVEAFVLSVRDVAIIQDLSNNDKHGYPSRDGGLSKLSPKLVNVRRVLRLSAGPNSGAGITIDWNGEQRIWGSDSTTLVITGDVVDGSGSALGDLQNIQSKAIEAWENQLALVRL